MRYIWLGGIIIILVLIWVPVVPAQKVQWSGNGHYYEAMLVPNGITWDDAKAEAIMAGGHLATITSDSENQFVYDLIKGDNRYWVLDPAGNNEGPWLGAYQPQGSSDPDGGWTWVTGEPFSYTNWASGEPNNWEGKEHYLIYLGHGNSQSSSWNDWTQDSKSNGYIAEWDTSQASGSTSDLNGNWLMGGPYDVGMSCQIIQQGSALTIINENGARSTGSFIDATTVIATDWEGGLKGTISSDGNRIDWANGTWWIRPSTSTIGSPSTNSGGAASEYTGGIPSSTTGLSTTTAIPGSIANSGSTVSGQGQGVALQNMVLTGVWSCDDGGTYYIRQLGDTIWWLGEPSTNPDRWSNVARGTISGNTITLEYSDIPKGCAEGYGTLVLETISNNVLNAKEKPASYGGSTWTRKASSACPSSTTTIPSPTTTGTGTTVTAPGSQGSVNPWEDPNIRQLIDEWLLQQDKCIKKVYPGAYIEKWGRMGPRKRVDQG
jgi:hypothetical protein